MDAFARRKADTLAELAIDGGDFSRAGHVDERARPVVALVNRHPDFFTTSSCAGRVSVFADPTTATRAAGMKGGEWVYVNHDPADAADVLAAVRSKLGASDAAGASAPDPECTLVLRFEPFILSVEAKTTRAGAALVAAARDAGYRESGVTRVRQANDHRGALLDTHGGPDRVARRQARLRGRARQARGDREREARAQRRAHGAVRRDVREGVRRGPRARGERGGRGRGRDRGRERAGRRGGGRDLGGGVGIHGG